MVDLSRSNDGAAATGVSPAAPMLGVYLPDTPPTLGPLQVFERVSEAYCAIASFYWSWGLGHPGEAARGVRTILAAGRLALLTWEPWRLPPAGADPATWPGNHRYRPRHIAEGAFDDDIDEWARALASVGDTVLLRPMHEMNGNWYPWCGTANANTPRDFIDAWRRLHGRFRAAGATRVQWVWCPYARSVPDEPHNAIERYFPGEEFVDWMAIDGYNWGDARPWSRWQEFREIFDAPYRTLTRLGSRPILIAELGCNESGGDKSAWMTRAWADLLAHFPRVRGAVWFDTAKECDWRVTSSTESLNAFRRSWASARAPAGALRT